MIAALAAFFEHPPAWIEIGGYTLVALVALELVIGKKRLGFAGRGFRRTHILVGWSIAAIMGLHAVIGIGHGLVGYLVRLK